MRFQAGTRTLTSTELITKQSTLGSRGKIALKRSPLMLSEIVIFFKAIFLFGRRFSNFSASFNLNFNLGTLFFVYI